MPVTRQLLRTCRMTAVFAALVLFVTTCGAIAEESVRYPYRSVPGDPLHTRIYVLENGVTVYMSPNKDVPKIFTAIAVRAGSKFDPRETTGLSHYLEHMLFKGTDSLGTLDYGRERVALEKITNLYERYRSISDVRKRAAIYREIDSISNAAARFAIPNEYDKLMNSIGAHDTNAYTMEEGTVFINTIPSNRLEQWLTIEVERFRNPVMRLFHTELEAVYEEKNMNMDSDANKLWEELLGGLFRQHPYGTQTTIGKAEHLKKPSIRNVINYYHTYYVPNNMAVCIAGDFDPDEAIRLIDRKFSRLSAKPVPEFHPPVEKPLGTPVVKTVTGPEAEEVVLGFRFGGVNTADADMLALIDRILYNQTAGLMDLNLNQNQKVLESASMLLLLKDYSVHLLSAKPRKGQSLEQLRSLLLDQLELMRQGRFPDWLPGAVINDLKLEELKQYETNRGRADAYIDNFAWGMDWNRYVNRFDRLEKITKQEIVDFVRKHYGSNYVVVYKRQGKRKSEAKIRKPPITPVKVNRDTSSVFAEKVLALNAGAIKPSFVDYGKDIAFLDVNPAVKLHYLQNNENELFSIYYVFDIGKKHNRKIDLALNYLSYLGTSKHTPNAFKQELYKLGISISATAADNYVYLVLTGLGKNEAAGIRMFEELLNDAKSDEGILGKLKSDALKTRNDDKLSKKKILAEAMVNYGKYGAVSPFTNVLGNDELEKTSSEELLEEVRNLLKYRHRVLYYGPSSSDRVVEELRKIRHYPASFTAPPVKDPFVELDQPENQVYLVDYDMNQVEIMMLTRDEIYKPSMVPQITLFNEYFGGGMASVVFQDMRESKALAYSVFSSYSIPRQKGKYNYIVSYIGTQSDKLPEALSGIQNLMNDMPKSSKLFLSAKNGILERMASEHKTKTGILFDYETAVRLGHNHDIREDIYHDVPSLSLADIENFHRKHFRNRKHVLLVLGKKSQLDMETLKKYGTVRELKLKDIFGY
ncbi:MAG: insulinase family protein [Chlorobiaceae bacterium]|nr:insulinase family protein [Chlorobiaceae bacterium]